LVADLWDWTNQGETMFDGSEDTLIEVDMEAGQPIKLLVKTTNEIRPVSK
jgi:beta-glucosidase